MLTTTPGDRKILSGVGGKNMGRICVYKMRAGVDRILKKCFDARIHQCFWWQVEPFVRQKTIPEAQSSPIPGSLLPTCMNTRLLSTSIQHLMSEQVYQTQSKALKKGKWNTISDLKKKKLFSLMLVTQYVIYNNRGWRVPLAVCPRGTRNK